MVIGEGYARREQFGGVPWGNAFGRGYGRKDCVPSLDYLTRIWKELLQRLNKSLNC